MHGKPSAQDIPPHVRGFIARHIDSVSTLDVLLLLRATPDRAWTAAEVGRALVTGELAARGPLELLAGHRLLDKDAAEFRYAPRPKDDAVIEELAESYARRRHAVIGVIFAADTGPATALADAFRFRPGKGADG